MRTEEGHKSSPLDKSYYLIGQTFSSTGGHQNKNITSTHCGINYLSLVGAK
jgi:hypothetical protein